MVVSAICYQYSATLKIVGFFYKELMMNLHWMSYALKITALFNVGAGILNLLLDRYSWAFGNFMFALALMISAMMAAHMFGSLAHVKVAKIKKKPWHPFD